MMSTFHDKSLSGEIDPARAAIKILQTPGAMPDLFRRVATGCRFEDKELMEVAYYLLARARLREHKIEIPLPECGISQALECLPVLAALEFIPESRKEVPKYRRDHYRRAYKGFEQFFDRPEIDLSREIAILQLGDDEDNKELRDLFKMSLEWLLLPIEKTDIKYLPETERLPDLKRQEPNEYTDRVIRAVRDRVLETFGNYFRFNQIQVLYEDIAFMRRFERNAWQVETKDVIDAWHYSFRFITWPPMIRDSHRKDVLAAVYQFNEKNVCPSQWKLVNESRINFRYVSLELKDDVGISIQKGFVEKCNPRGYRLTEHGRRLFLNDYSIKVDDVIYRPDEEVCQ